MTSNQGDNVAHAGVTAHISVYPHIQHDNTENGGSEDLQPGRLFCKSSFFTDLKCCLRVDQRPKCIEKVTLKKKNPTCVQDLK